MWAPLAIATGDTPPWPPPLSRSASEVRVALNIMGCPVAVARRILGANVDGGPDDSDTVTDKEGAAEGDRIDGRGLRSGATSSVGGD